MDLVWYAYCLVLGINRFKLFQGVVVKLLYYNPVGLDDLGALLHDATTEFEIVFFDDLQALLQFINRPLVGYDHMAILAPRDKREMELLRRSRSHFRGMNLIVILTDETANLVPQAHKLMPRVVFTYTPGAEIIVQLLKKYGETRARTEGAA